MVRKILRGSLFLALAAVNILAFGILFHITEIVVLSELSLKARLVGLGFGLSVLWLTSVVDAILLATWIVLGEKK